MADSGVRCKPSFLKVGGKEDNVFPRAQLSPDGVGHGCRKDLGRVIGRKGLGGTVAEAQAVGAGGYSYRMTHSVEGSATRISLRFSERAPSLSASLP